jgi:RimJ/RimL family protein N-acetyltransferase
MRLVLRSDVRLVPVGPEHAGTMHAWMCDPEVSRNIGLRTAPSPDRTRAWIARALENTAIHAFAILVETRHVGNVVLDQVDEYLSTARLSLYVGEPSARGAGIGQTAVFLALREAFAALGLHKVWLTVHCRNAAAVRLYEQLGFVVEGVLRGEFLLDGERIDAIRMGVLRDESEASGAR